LRLSLRLAMEKFRSLVERPRQADALIDEVLALIDEMRVMGYCTKFQK